MQPTLILSGGGGHCRACIDVIEKERRFRIAGIIDLPHKLRQVVCGYEIIATDREISNLTLKFDHFFVTLGQIKDPRPRINLFNKLENAGADLPVIISPLAHVSKHATIGAGTIIMHHAVVNAGARVGKGCIINTKALVEHDVGIGDFCHLAPGAIVNGAVKMKAETFIGSNAVISHKIKIGRNVVVGAGVALFHDLEDNTGIRAVNEIQDIHHR